MKRVVEIDEEERDTMRHFVVQLVHEKAALDHLLKDGVVWLRNVSLVVTSHNQNAPQSKTIIQTHDYRNVLCRIPGSGCPT